MCKLVKIFVFAVLLFIGSTAIAQDKFKLISLNVFSFEPDFDLTPWKQFFKEQNADIICLNEVENRSSRQMVNDKYRDVVYELANHLNMFAEYGFSYSLNNKNEDYDIEKDKYSKNELYGNAILSRYPIINSVQYLLPRPPGSADRRSIIIVDLLLPSNNVVRVACTHLDHMGGQVQQQEYLGNIKELNQDMPTLVVGDFNSQVFNAKLLSRYDYLQTHWVDHILGNKGYWQTLKGETLNRIYKGKELSDLHSPQLVELKCLKF